MASTAHTAAGIGLQDGVGPTRGDLVPETAVSGTTGWEDLEAQVQIDAESADAGAVPAKFDRLRPSYVTNGRARA